MNESRTLQLFTAITVIVVGLASALSVGADMITLIVMMAMGVLLIGVMWDRHREQPSLAPMPAPASPPPVNLLELASFSRIVEGLLEPVLIVENGRVAMANSGALKLLGDHIVGEDIRIAIRHPAVAERLAGNEQLEAAVKIDIVGLGTRNQRWTMQIIPIDLRNKRQRLFVHLADESGTYVAERVRGDFVANASHELRTPLAAILGFIETLQDANAGGEPETRKRFLSILEKEARRMQQLVDDLMSLSRIEADKHRLPSTHIEMPALVDEVLRLCRQNLGKRGADIIAEIADDIPPVQGDRTQITQVLHNLLSNSAKYGKPATPIIVRLSAAPSSMVRLEVSDEGEGIAADHIPRLTERFYRVDSGRSRAMGGTGLGLAIVKHIIERHRGRLDIASILGKGTSISVLLPQASPSKKDPDAPPHEFLENDN